MGKLAEPPISTVASDPTEDSDVILMEGTEAQRAKNQAALDWLKRRQAEYAAMSSAEKAMLEVEWAAFRDLVNANHSGGGRPIRE